MKHAVFAMLVCAVSSIAAAQVTMVHAGRLVEPDSGTVLTDQVILVDDGKIQAVGKGLVIPAGAKVIDLSDKTVLPGLIDCHTHLADGNGLQNGDPFNILEKTASRVVLESVRNARVTLLSGFTTVRDVGTYRALNDIALRDAIADGEIIGPRMYVAGAYITITGGAGAMTGQAPDIQLPWDLHYGEANSPWEVHQKVRLLAHDGVDHIKILSKGAVLTHGSSPNAAEFTRPPWKKRGILDCAWKRLRTIRRESRMPSGPVWRRLSTLAYRRRGNRAGQEERHLLGHGYLRRRVHPGRGKEGNHPARFSGARPRPGREATAELPKSGGCGGEDGVRHRSGSVPVRGPVRTSLPSW